MEEINCLKCKLNNATVLYYKTINFCKSCDFYVNQNPFIYNNLTTLTKQLKILPDNTAPNHSAIIKRLESNIINNIN